MALIVVVVGRLYGDRRESTLRLEESPTKDRVTLEDLRGEETILVCLKDERLSQPVANVHQTTGNELGMAQRGEKICNLYIIFEARLRGIQPTLEGRKNR